MTKEQTKIVFIVAPFVLGLSMLQPLIYAVHPSNWNPCHIEYQADHGSETCLKVMEVMGQ